jgi:hypothetical protein
MPTDNAYDEILDKLADSHQQRVADSLVKLEERVANVMAGAPLKDGLLFDTEWAISVRGDLRAALDEEYLSEVDSIVRGYGSVAVDAQDMLGQYGDFTKLDTSVVNQLQQLSFQGFESVANEYLDVLANEVYQSTLTGRSFNDTVKNLRQTINGVYIQSDDVEAQRLVDIANSGSPAAAKEAAEQLRTKYARDRAGNNLRRYSTQMAQDSLMQFDASINTAIGKASGATKWKYYGDVIRDSRPFCVEHANQVFDEDEIESTWSGSWKGKSSGDPFIVRGGYNCRHHWRPVFDEEDIITEEKPSSFSFNRDVDISGDKEGASVAMGLLAPNVLQAINKVGQPKTIVATKGSKGLYWPNSKKLQADPSVRNGSVVRHEYGHHLDFELGAKLGLNSRKGLSEQDGKFKAAFKEDKKLNKLMPKDKKQRGENRNRQLVFKSEMYDETRFTEGGITYKKTIIKDPELGNLMDIYDALSDGQFHTNYGGFGHGVSYYKKDAANKYLESFANLTALRGTDQWDTVKKYYPNMAKRYDEIMDEALGI